MQCCWTRRLGELRSSNQRLLCRLNRPGRSLRKLKEVVFWEIPKLFRGPIVFLKTSKIFLTFFHSLHRHLLGYNMPLTGSVWWKFQGGRHHHDVHLCQEIWNQNGCNQNTTWRWKLCQRHIRKHDVRRSARVDLSTGNGRTRNRFDQPATRRDSSDTRVICWREPEYRQQRWPRSHCVGMPLEGIFGRWIDMRRMEPSIIIHPWR